jgi:predicted DNA-binding antitoxin AbrB/MazE fold protein
MSQELEAVFDGTVLQPQQPLNLVAGTRVRIIVESIVPNNVEQPKTFLQTAQSLQLQGKPDWSEQVDQYLYGKTSSDEE